ncbi:MAG: amidohydrolase family protein, partial [Cyclobacteriaceae bacterium]
TNINLFDWPFRKLKYGDTEALMAKLRTHRVEKAWAGSFEALFHKDIDGVNSRLAKECSNKGKGMLVPFGTVNLAWPDWEEDLRRCQEEYKMPGVRIYPIYQTFDPDHPDFTRLVEQVDKRNMILQIVGDMDDIRNHHPIVLTRELNMHPIVDILKKFPQAKIQMLYWNHRVGADVLERLVKETNTVFDTARIETSGGVGRLIEGKPWSGIPDIPVPVERILFGSHAPYFPIESSLLKLMEAPLKEDQAKAIMQGNALRFLGKS